MAKFYLNGELQQGPVAQKSLDDVSGKTLAKLLAEAAKRQDRGQPARVEGKDLRELQLRRKKPRPS